MTFLRWIFSLSVLAIWCALIGTALYVAMYEDPETIGPAQAVVVLGGNGPGPSGLDGESAERLDRAIALMDAETAPVLVVTGGGPSPVGPTMKDAAVAAGLDGTQILVDAQAASTLQNALFTADFDAIDKTQPIIIVSHKYHLPRAWASFRWAGFQNVTTVAADPDTGFILTGHLMMESLKWPFNVLRAAAASAAMAGDVPRENYIKYLE